MKSPRAEARRIVFTGKQSVSLETFDLPKLQPRQVLVETTLSLMSTGTENIIFNRLFDAGTHFDKWVEYPFFPGYACVGRVVEAGGEAGEFAPGNRVAYRVGHRSHDAVDASACVKIPDNISDEEAVWFAIAKIGFHGARAADYRLGDDVLVIGAGPIGQVSVRWAAAAGARSIIAVDGLRERLAFAAKGGATAGISSPIQNCRNEVINAAGNQPPRIVVDSTGNSAVFSEALKLAADFGRVVVLGDTGTPAKQSLSPDVITRGISIIGAHDNHTTPEWNARSIPDLFFRLAAAGRFDVRGLNTHSFSPEACSDAYQAANRDRGKTMGIVFDWRK